MEDLFKIPIDRLKDGVTETISEMVPPDFLTVDDANLLFKDPVELKGQAYLAQDHLILTLDAKSNYIAICKICNEQSSFPLDLESLYITEDIQNIPSKVYNFKENLRSAILLEIPMYHECNGNCSKREELKQYLNPSSN